MKLDPAELTRIGKDESPIALVKNEMVVFRRPKPRWFDEQLAGHTEVKPEPIVAGKAKKHSLATRFRT